ncbi:TonB-dependent receptor domain-containing protein [Algihabitans albus]|uniref:TonB-dependent receptor domain-containing protein n=1 Tax=Algihabitans albus TaxID=2164067 RepID=UPI000E5CC90C|nr:TonB-dependent receptor [Algihabitans albus]
MTESSGRRDRENLDTERLGLGEARALLLGVWLLPLLISAPVQAEDWQRRLKEFNAGAELRFELAGHQLAQLTEPEQWFDLPAGDLETALLAFSQAVDLQLLYPAALTAGLETRGLQGSYRPEQALQLLIAGTGLTYRFTDTTTVTLAQTAPQEGSAGEDAPLRLDPVTVTGARFATPISELPSSNTVLGQSDLDAQPSFQRDAVGGLAKVVPGLNFTSPLGSTATLRGRDVSVRINNIEINQRFRPTGNSIFDLPASAFRRVEVVRGADATFGFGASGGAVNFRTPEPIPGEMQLETTVGLSLQPTDIADSVSPEVRQSATGSLDRLDYWVEVGGEINQSLFDPDGDPLPDSDNTFPNSNVIDVNTNLVFNLDEDQRIKTTHFYVKTSQDPEFVAVADGDVDTGRKTSTARFEDIGEAFQDSFRRQYVGTASYENDDILGNRLDLTLFYQDRVLQQLPAEIVPPLFIQVREENRRLGGRLNIETPLAFLDNGWFSGSTVTWGGDLQRFVYDAEETIDPAVPFAFIVPDAIETSRAVFAQLRAPFLEDFLITGGVRYEATDVEIGSANLAPAFGGNFEGGDVNFDQALFNAGLIYFVTDEVELYGSFSQAADVLDLARAPRLTTITSADDIRPEPATTDQFEVGVRGGWRKIQATASLFYSESDLANQFTVVPDSGFAAPVRRPQEIWGAEITLDTQPWEEWGFGGSLSFSEGMTELENGDTVDLSADSIQPLRFTGYVEYKPFSWWRNRIQVSHQTSADASPQLDRSGVKPLTFVDVYSEAEVGPGRLRLGVENLFNTEEFNPTAQTNRSNTLGQITNVPFPGTTLNIRYSMRW